MLLHSAPGSYAYQVDGVDFSEVIVFQAIPALSDMCGKRNQPYAGSCDTMT